ncbi:MAG TPA: DUF5666 domain-containing protein, partial [Pseudomonadales bacterium]|nr:DUF5666 domain-containing protein [Pseudomonadales bacterium]
MANKLQICTAVFFFFFHSVDVGADGGGLDRHCYETKATLHVISSGGFAAALDSLIPGFTEHTGIAIDLSYGSSSGGAPDSIPERLKRGEVNDDSREHQAELQGQVTAVYSDRIEIQSPNHASTLTVNIGAGTVVYDESDRSSRNNTSAIVVGDYVEIYGDYYAATASIAAANVRIDSDNDSGEYRQDNDTYYEVEGRVVSYDGSTLVLDVREANFFPGANTVTVSAVANASFQTGIASDVSVGQWLEINGQWDGQTFTANYVEIEGG